MTLILKTKFHICKIHIKWKIIISSQFNMQIKRAKIIIFKLLISIIILIYNLIKTYLLRFFSMKSISTLPQMTELLSKDIQFLSLS